jgi:hypothetical protein
MKKEDGGKQPKGGLARYIWAERRRGAEGGRSALVYAGRTRQHLKLTPLDAFEQTLVHFCGPSQFCHQTRRYHPLRVSSIHSNNLPKAVGA